LPTHLTPRKTRPAHAHETPKANQLGFIFLRIS
jgi:hypothetical protein